MTKFTATFSNGQTATRNSDHAYAFAWAVICIADGKVEKSGFSADRANAAKSAQAGDYSQVLDSSRWEDSIRLATGGIDKYNGKAIVLPWGQEYGQFRDGLNIRLQDIWASGRLDEGMTMSKLRDMPLEMAGDGRYVLKAGDGILVDKNNQPVFIDFNKEPTPTTMGGIPTDKELREAAKPYLGRALPKKDNK